MIIFINKYGQPEALTRGQLESRVEQGVTSSLLGRIQWRGVAERGITAGFDRRESNTL